MKQHLWIVLASGMAMGVGSAAAQESTPPPAARPIAAVAPPVQPVPPAEPPAPERPKHAWSSAEFEAIGAMLAGSWKSNAPIAGTQGATGEVVMSVAPVGVNGLTDTLYVEVARADTLHRPYRQTILQLHAAGGKTHLRTMEFRRVRGEMPQSVGLWAAPEVFPIIGGDDLITTLDIDLAKTRDGYAGKTPHAYPTSTGGAHDMTSEITIAKDRIELADRGTGADGQQVWGPKAGERTTFTRTETGVKAARLEGGLVVIDFPGASEGGIAGDAATEGQIVNLDYAGYLEDGTVFDSSYERGQPFMYPYGQPLIAGWNTAMTDVKKGMQRRLIIPAPLAYGPRARGKIPANSTLIFDIRVNDIEQPPAPPTPPPAPEGQPQQGQPEGQPQPQSGTEPQPE